MARQAPLSMGFSRQEYWSGLPSPSPGDLLNPWNWEELHYLRPLQWQESSLLLAPPGKPLDVPRVFHLTYLLPLAA